MSVVTVGTPALPSDRDKLAGALRSEWTKLRSVRSTSWSLVATAVLTIAIGILATSTEAGRWAHANSGDRRAFDPTSLSLAGFLFGQLAIGVLGVLVVSAEYSTGTIRATFGAIPRRTLVLGAKVAVFSGVAFVLGEVLAFSSFFIGQAVLSGSAPTATLGQPGVLRAVIGGGLFLTVLGLFALGLGTIVRHSAGAITGFVAIFFVIPLIVEALPSSIKDAVGKYLPDNIGATMTTVKQGFRTDVPTFSPWVSFGLLCGYAAAALVVGGILLARRDA
ncbi:MAG TPA: ABC transporter permease [Acidimicrobiales bacterium]|nr:ABC transporter permease [Acidimicrobiales bacterium]